MVLEDRKSEGTINAQKYTDVLETKLLSSAQSLFVEGNWMFQDNNASCHQEKLVEKLMQAHRWTGHQILQI